jgi:hypothetical protein
MLSGAPLGQSLQKRPAVQWDMGAPRWRERVNWRPKFDTSVKPLRAGLGLVESKRRCHLTASAFFRVFAKGCAPNLCLMGMISWMEICLGRFCGIV